ncbi:NAD-dependent epimerase/dehydratase family protein [Pedobacter panaciterrae]|uniref:NAD-dependent epimerase/dehydratase family protein n=1 Tax=Pedobacter panaciterrae TaxID=363849 RepID=UPI00155DAC61|nr:NAD-dependent epimerase/dehydratase family protein [Pedobacter panaciterrae]NQX55198.1 NAD-dependent epimerase/dehydratase family protein [Pedobacter panaciterrae]
MHKILLTGSTGFVGTNLVKHIQENNIGEILLLSFREALPTSLEGDVVVHLAGKAHDLKNTSNPQEYFEVNFEKTRDLFNLFLNSENKDFIYFSSVKAVADTVNGALIEDVIADPQTPYGKSKLQAERHLLSKNLPVGKRLFILRPCMIHGPGNKGNLNLLYKVVKKGIPYPLAGFENQRSFLSIQNLNYIIEKILTDQSIPGGIYNVADDEPLSTNQVIEIMAEVQGSKAKLWRINSGIIKTIAAIGDKLHLPLNSERLKKLTESYVVSNNKIKHALKIENLPINSKEGLLTTIRSFRSS